MKMSQCVCARLPICACKKCVMSGIQNSPQHQTHIHTQTDIHTHTQCKDAKAHQEIKTHLTHITHTSNILRAMLTGVHKRRDSNLLTQSNMKARNTHTHTHISLAQYMDKTVRNPSLNILSFQEEDIFGVLST